MWRRKKAAQQRDGRDARRSASAERQPRQRYARDGEQVLQFRPSQVGVSSIAARRREQKIEAAWSSDISDWERKMRTLKDAVQHERALETESSGQSYRVASHGGRPVSSAAADATVSAFLAETRVRNEMAQRSAGAAAATPAPSAPKAEPAREEAGQVVDEELMDAILLEAA